MLRGQTCCFTGHRQIPPEAVLPLQNALRRELIRLIAQGYRYFGAGGALGFDMLAEQTVLQLRAEYPQIRLILVLPCESQAKRWSRENRVQYDAICRQADKVVYTSRTYDPGCMQRRNRYLVDHSSFCVCYLTKPTGGTAYTACYAKQNGVSTINLAAAVCMQTGVNQE